MFGVFSSVFAELRTEFAARTLTDIKEYVLGEESRKVLSMLGEVLRLRSGLVAHPGTTSMRRLQDTGAVIPKAATWNFRGGQKSDQAPESWSQEGRRNELVNEMLRWDCDVVALQEVESEGPIERLAHRHSHVASSESHLGFVRLYVSKRLTFVVTGGYRLGVVVCSLFLKVAGSDDEHSRDLLRCIFRHASSSIVKGMVSKSGDTGVLVPGDTNSKDE